MARTNYNGKHASMELKDFVPTHLQSEYHPNYDDVAFNACRHLGTSRGDLTRLFSVGLKTLYSWIRLYPTFENAIRDGMWAFDSKEVVRSLKEKCLGYRYVETKEEAVMLLVDGKEQSFVRQKKPGRKGKNGKGKSVAVLVPGIKRTITHKTVPPSDLAIMFWLQNRQSDEWKNVQRQIVETTGTMKHKHEHDHKHKYDLGKLSRGQLEELDDLIGQAAPDEEGSEESFGRKKLEAFHSSSLAACRN